MRGAALLLATASLAIATLAAACAAPAPTPRVTSSLASSLAPSAAAVATAVPTPTPTVAPVPTETVVIPEETLGPSLRPLEVDWAAAPEFPSPILVVGSTRVRAIGESGCPTLIFEPADDPLDRAETMQVACVLDPVLPFTKAIRVIAGSDLVFEAPQGWRLGAQVASDAAPYGPFWIIEANRLASRPAGPTALRAVGGGGVELARGEGFRLDSVDALAPDAPGDYLVSVQAQVGQVPDGWRTLGRTYYYWVQIR